MSSNEVVIRFCVGEKGSRRAVVEMWVAPIDVEDIIEEAFRTNGDITLAQVFEDGEFVIQYERR